mgnify:CR=1 FL=1
MRLGELLISKGVITEAQLLSALRRHYTTHDMLGECLILEGVITEQMMLLAVGEQTGMSYVDPIPGDGFTSLSLGVFSASLANKLCSIAGQRGSELVVYINGNPDAITPHLNGCGMDVVFVLSRKSQIRQAISSAYQRFTH